MGIGYVVRASCFGTSLYLCFQACLTVYSRWASQISFRNDHTKRDETSL